MCGYACAIVHVDMDVDVHVAVHMHVHAHAHVHVVVHAHVAVHAHVLRQGCRGAREAIGSNSRHCRLTLCGCREVEM